MLQKWLKLNQEWDPCSNKHELLTSWTIKDTCEKIPHSLECHDHELSNMPEKN